MPKSPRLSPPLFRSLSRPRLRLPPSGVFPRAAPASPGCPGQALRRFPAPAREVSLTGRRSRLRRQRGCPRPVPRRPCGQSPRRPAGSAPASRRGASEPIALGVATAPQERRREIDTYLPARGERFLRTDHGSRPCVGDPRRPPHGGGGAADTGPSGPACRSKPSLGSPVPVLHRLRCAGWRASPEGAARKGRIPKPVLPRTAK
jgi:hypothetical protein